MNPTLKKILTAVALKQVWDRVQEARQPKRSKAAKMGPALAALGVAGVGGYLLKSGKLQSLMGRGPSQSPYEPAAYPAGTTPSETSISTSTKTNGLGTPEPINV